MNRSWVRRLAALAVAAALIPACHGGSSNPIVTANTGIGTFVQGLIMSAHGGTGSTGTGGGGGSIDIYNDGGADVKVLTSGTVDASFDLPPILTPYLGTNPYTVAANTNMTTVAALTAAGQVLRGASTNTFFGDDGATPATGLHVLPGVTLVIPAHVDTDNADADADAATGTFEDVNIDLAFGILIQGTLRSGRQDLAAQDDGLGVNSGELSTLDCQSIVIGPNGIWDFSGSDNPGGIGGTGSGFSPSGGGVTMDTFVNQGLFDVSGGNGDVGGDGGDISTGVSGMWNTGTINSFGGNGANGDGGTGGDQHWDLNNGQPLGGFNSGTMDCSGGDAMNGNGGDAGDFEIDPHEDPGSVISSGIIDASGGDVLGGNGDGGSGDSFDPDVGNGDLIFTGIIDLSGGNGSGTGNGGNGSTLDILHDTGTNLVSGTEQPGQIWVGATIDVSGGNGVNGGGAGSIEIGMNLGTGCNCIDPGEHVVRVVGYSTLDASGGNGATSGGGAGSIDITTSPSDDAGGNQYVGDIEVTSNLLAQGGDATAGPGGSGGNITIDSDLQAVPFFGRAINVSGSLDSQGGDGSTTGGSGGDISLQNRFDITATGAMDSSGGMGGTASGGNAGQVDVQSDEDISVGAIAADGGDSTTGGGGDGNTINILALRKATGSGAISSNGGDSGGTGNGGDGNDIDIASLGDGSSLSGTPASNGGAATGTGTDGTNGFVTVDGIIVAGP